ncbi:hypothetical protein GMORB2_7151 [Geosmithia morbida]|uniref:V-snare n=1 Tax=Geosmithia morbida TaxID=1094350 RepID=A0A9P4YW31_9HYPO|nr:uncharacterized protein GMORB2_7151 [Geosmithia morbida]KAF4122844.1 hypothetical protein GMORB2_7151 [Geosmithia morbida]
MSYKREHPDVEDDGGDRTSDVDATANKRARQDGQQPQHKRRKTRPQQGSGSSAMISGADPTWGQKYVFSSRSDATTIPPGEEDDFEDDTDAMSYLMAVRYIMCLLGVLGQRDRREKLTETHRQEAHGIPHLLVAPKPQIGPQLPAEYQRDDDEQGEAAAAATEAEQDGDDNGEIYTSQQGGWYEDGAYIADPDDDDDDDDQEEQGDSGRPASERAVQTAYFDSILRQYLSLRTVLHSAAARVRTRASLPPLPRGTPTDAPPFGRNSPTTATWCRAVRNSDPHPAQLARMTKDSVLRVLRVILGGKFLRQGYGVEERTSRWLWALLARLPDRGSLNHAEVGWVRDLGRRAVLLGRSLAEMATLRDELDEGALGLDEAVNGSSGVVADVEAEREKYTQMDHRDKEKEEEEEEEEEEPETQLDGKEEDQEEGEIDDDDDDDDIAMEIASNSSVDKDDVPHKEDDLEDARARLLAQLDQVNHDDRDRQEEAARDRARINMRATLNMILTVAGEFYGQRDLLEFREPFVGM